MILDDEQQDATYHSSLHVISVAHDYAMQVNYKASYVYTI